MESSKINQLRMKKLKPWRAEAFESQLSRQAKLAYSALSASKIAHFGVFVHTYLTRI